ncbi:hypothetical protein [Dysosmobacter sp.]|jgi:hypothetical protein|uniref:hypothetical protein n=1 Tax=Dysosmobacter sp. TaxID=2591382 RepID=UPI003AB575A0
MWEITVESKTRVIECGRAVLYETKYRGLQEETGKIRLLSYFGKRMPLAEAQLMELPKPESNMKDAA